jgi:hypothetical protein
MDGGKRGQVRAASSRVPYDVTVTGGGHAEP